MIRTEVLEARPSAPSPAPVIPACLNSPAKFTSRSECYEEISIVKTHVLNRLAEIRKSRGVGASDLALRVHVSRQTIYAIEAGTYVPNTEVALSLAQELEVTVDELFTLEEDRQEGPESLAAEVLSGTAVGKGQPVRLCQVETRWI